MLVQSNTAKLTGLFQKAGIKATKKRIAIYHALVVANRALSPYELAKYCDSEFDLSIPVVSIYRTLDLLVAVNLAHKLELVNKYIVCAHSGCHSQHQHSQFLICNVCHKVTEIHLSTALTQQLTEKIAYHGFELQSPQYEFQGICKTCAMQAQKS